MMKVLPAVLSLALVATTLPLGAQPRTKRIGRVAETSLVGIPLYSPGLKVVNKFGPPDEILGITLGGSGNAGGDGGGGGLQRGRGGGGGGAAPGSPGAGEDAPNLGTRPGGGEDFIGDPFSNVGWKQNAASDAPSMGGEGGPPLPGSPGGGDGRQASGGGGGGSTTSSSVQYTKWVYKRKNARYSFVIDKFNRVVQIEAVGINDPNVRTARGVKFGNNFKELSNKYFQPDGYDLAGDSFVVKYLQRGKVAFRFSRLEANKPHVITGIVVAAGK